jgi:uncharacterized protein YjbJ (UPF0337 family)
VGRSWQARARQVEEQAGKLTGDKDTQAEGVDDQIEGKAQEAWGKTKEKVKEIKDKVR